MKLVLLLLIIVVFITSHVCHQVLFEKIGRMTTSVNYGHLHLYLNFSEVKQQISDLHLILGHVERATYNVSDEKVRARAIHMFASLKYETNTLQLELNDITFPFENPSSAGSHRAKRFLGLLLSLGLGTIGTFMGLFNQGEINSLQSSMSDIASRQDHIIEALQSHEVRIRTNEEDIRRLNYTLTRVTTIVEANAFTGHLHELELRILHIIRRIRDNLNRIQHTVDAAMNHRLSISSVHASSLISVLSRFENSVQDMGYETLISDVIHLFQLETSFIYDKTGISMFVHVPLVRKDGFLDLYKYVPFPVPLDNHTSLALYISPPEDLLAISGSTGLHKILSTQDLAFCSVIGEVYQCRSHNVLHKRLNSSCLGALFLQQMDTAKLSCPLSIKPNVETIHQRGRNQFIVSSPVRQTLMVSCPNGTNFPHGIEGQKDLYIPTKCWGKTDQHKFYSDLEFDYPEKYVILQTHWVASDLLENISFPHLENLLSSMKDLGLPPDDIRSIRKDFHLQAQSQDFINRSPVWWPHIINFSIAVGLLIMVSLLVCGLVRSYSSYRHQYKHINDQLEMKPIKPSAPKKNDYE